MVADDWLPATPELRPRMKMLPEPGPLAPKLTFGVYFTRSLKLVTLSWLSVRPVNACMVAGTF
jgi:hypothetical protein